MSMFRGSASASAARVVSALVLVGLAASCSSSSTDATAAVAPDASTPTTTPATATDGGTSTMWVVSWGNSPENALGTTTNQAGSERSFRMLFRPTIDGTQARVRLSNYFGTTPITVGAARIASAPNDDATIDTANDFPLSFGGASSVTIQPGQEVTSDAIGMSLVAEAPYAVTVYVSGAYPALTHHISLIQTNFMTQVGAGDKTTDATGASFSVPVAEWFLLSGVDVYGSYQGTVALLGSSSIDGANSDKDDTAEYPAAQTVLPKHDFDRPSDWLGRQLLAAGYRMGVLNAGVLGDPAGANAVATPATGIASGVDRIQRDVIAQPNVKTVIIYLGGIDIRSAECHDAPDIEASLTTMTAAAHAAGIRVILATVPPAAYCSNTGSPNYGPVPSTAEPFAGDVNPGPENPGSAQRRALNDWIRTSGPTLPGVVGIADFDKALASPDHPDFLIPKYNSGDNFHPNGPGYGVQSSAIPLSAILP